MQEIIQTGLLIFSYRTLMQAVSTPGRISFLRAFLVSMCGVAILFCFLTTGIWVYTSEVLKRERSLISDLLPELDVAFQLTVATAGLQSEGLLLLSSRNSTELERGSAALFDSVSTIQKTIGDLAVTDVDTRVELETSAGRILKTANSLVEIKQLNFDLQERVLTEKLLLRADLDKIERLVERQVSNLSEELFTINEQMALSADNNRDGQQIARVREFADRAAVFESTNLAIQDYLLFAKDIVLLKALIEKVPLLTGNAQVDESIQERGLLLGKMVSRSIYLNDQTVGAALIEQLHQLHERIHNDQSLFELQKQQLFTQELIYSSIGDLMAYPVDSILSQTDLLQNGTRSTVNDLARKTLEGLEIYRILLIAVSTLVLLLLSAVSYWLVYRRTVQPLQQITRQLDDVGSERFPAVAKPYLLKELHLLSAATMQLDEAQKSMQFQDIQLQGINDNLQRANTELEQFAHVASHDLQEPLRKLQQFSDLLVEDYGTSLDEDGKFFVASIHSSAKRMSNLISDTLAYSRAGGSGQLLESVDLSELVLDLSGELVVAIEEVQGEVEVGFLPVVLANRLGMVQLFQNLLTNALKYRQPDTAARVSISLLSAGDDTDGSVVIRVADNGIGIEEQHLERIFQPFERLRSKGVRGTGLGLAICQKVCAAHAWELDVSSTPSVGTRFDIRIPAVSVQDEELREAA